MLVRAVLLTAAMVVLSPAGARAQFTGVVVPPKKAEAEASPTVVAARNDSIRETRLTDMRATAEYRMLVAKNLLRRFYLETTGTKAPVQVSRHEAAR